MQVLLAEDKETNQLFGTRLLEKAGHNVTVAVNGRVAVQLAEAQRYDIILMDVQMPELDGIEATQRIRAREAGLGIHTPIIAMTANATADDRRLCLAAGMDGFLSKPVRSDEIIAVIHQHAGISALPLPPGDDCMDAGGRATPGAVAEGRGEGTSNSLPLSNPLTLPSPGGRGGAVFDISDALQRLNGNAVERRHSDATRRAAHS